MKTLEPPPEPNRIDKAAQLARAIAEEVPGGTVAVRTFDLMFRPPFEERSTAWMRKVHELLQELESRGVNLDELAARPAFVTAVHDASRVALGEHLEQKLDLLKAVLFNAATMSPDRVADLWTLRYIRWIDELEPEHIALLDYASRPEQWFAERGLTMPELDDGRASSTARELFDAADLPVEGEHLELVLEDLARLNLGVPNTLMGTEQIRDPWISERGRRFLGWLRIA